MRTARSGVAIPLVMVLLVVVLPVVAALFLRSQHTVIWTAKLQARDSATALAEEGEATALDSLRAGGGACPPTLRPTPDGSRTYAVYAFPPGAAGQIQYLVVSEGLHLGEERAVLSVAEVSLTSGTTLVIPRDRAWLPATPDARSFDPADLIPAHQARVNDYLDRIALEQPVATPDHSASVHAQLPADNPAIEVAWTLAPPASLLNRVEDAKVKPEPPPPLTLAQLTDRYQTLYHDYLEFRSAGQLTQATAKYDEFLAVFRVYQLRAR